MRSSAESPKIHGSPGRRERQNARMGLRHDDGRGQGCFYGSDDLMPPKGRMPCFSSTCRNGQASFNCLRRPQAPASLTFIRGPRGVAKPGKPQDRNAPSSKTIQLQENHQKGAAVGSGSWFSSASPRSANFGLQIDLSSGRSEGVGSGDRRGSVSSAHEAKSADCHVFMSCSTAST